MGIVRGYMLTKFIEVTVSYALWPVSPPRYSAHGQETGSSKFVRQGLAHTLDWFLLMHEADSSLWSE
jgi:hypothetical protein